MVLVFGYNIPYFQYFGSVAIGIGITAFTLVSIRNRNADRGTRDEANMVAEEGLVTPARNIREIQSMERAEAKAERNLESNEKKEESTAKDGGDLNADQAVEQGADAAKHQAKAEDAGSAVEGRVIGAVAAVKEIARALIEFSANKRNNAITEQQETQILDGILKKISNTRNYGTIDSRVSSYLREFLGELVVAFQNDIATEKNKEKLMTTLTKRLTKACKVMRKSLKGARIELNKLRKEERKTRKHFRKELKDIINSIKRKRNELKRLNRSGNPNPQVMASLQQEIKLGAQQYSDAVRLNGQVEATYKFIKKSVRQMRQLLRLVLRNEKRLKNYERSLEKRESEIARRGQNLELKAKSIQGIAQKFQNSNPHEIALVLSGNLKGYFDVYKKIIEGDIDFGNIVKEINAKTFVISQQMEAFEKFKISLDRSEEAVETGVEAMTELVGGIVGGSSKRNVSGIIQQLKNSSKIIDYETGIETSINSLLQSLEFRSAQLNRVIKDLTNRDMQLLEQVKAEEQSNSSLLGSVMATAVQRKISIDGKYIEEARKFGNQLNQYNGATANAYSQALNAEWRAAAA